MDKDTMQQMAIEIGNQLAERIGNQIGVVHEAFQHKLDLVVEGQQLLAEKFDRLDGRVGNLEVKMERVEVRLDAVEHRLGKLEAKVDQHDGRFDRVEVKVDGIAGDLTAHRLDTEAHRGAWGVRETGHE